MRLSFGTVVLTAGLVTAAACSSDSTAPALKPPDGHSCTQGTISANGPGVSGTVTTSDCRLLDVWNSETTYSASYAIALTAGKIYSVTTSGNITGGAMGNSLVAQNGDSELTVAISDGYTVTGATNNVLWFYAPTGGTYSLRAFDYDTADLGMTYSMQVSSCPIVATVATADTDYVDSTSTLGTSGCKQQYTFFSDDSSFVNYYLVQFAANQTRYILLQSSAFTPGSEIGGPNFDSMWDLNGNGESRGGNDEEYAITADTAGTYTLAVGSTTYGGAGAYRLGILAPSLAPQHAPPPPLMSRAQHLNGSQRIHIAR